MARKWQLNVSIMHDGKPIMTRAISGKSDINKLVTEVQTNLNKAIDTTTKIFSEKQNSDLLSIVQSVLQDKNRPRIDERGIQLIDMYQQALKAGRYTIGKNSNTMLFLDESVLDKLSIESDDDPWWRLYEYGSVTSRAGKSFRYAFIKKPGYGKHGEGFMVKTNEPSYTHPGVRPFHVLWVIQDYLESNRNGGKFGQAVMELFTSYMR